MAHREHWLIQDSPHESYETYLTAVGRDVVREAREKDPLAIVAALESSALRGRGGAGFPTGTKWRAVATHSCQTRYVVCNGAEGEPGTFKDRYLLRHNPYAILEGLLVAAHVVGAKGGYIALKASFKREIARVERALKEMTERGTVDAVSITLYAGPEEYLFGEEKALLNVIEEEARCPEKRTILPTSTACSQPRPRPTRPSPTT